MPLTAKHSTPYGWNKVEKFQEKERKGKPFSGAQKQAKRMAKTTEIFDPHPRNSCDCCDSESKMSKPVSSSRKKKKLKSQIFLYDP